MYIQRGQKQEKIAKKKRLGVFPLYAKTNPF